MGETAADTGVVATEAASARTAVVVKAMDVKPISDEVVVSVEAAGEAIHSGLFLFTWKKIKGNLRKRYLGHLLLTEISLNSI